MVTHDDHHLTVQDIEDLLNDPSEDVRAGIAEKVALEVGDQELSDEERNLAHSILREMVQDAADRVRYALSISLQSTPGVPHDVAVTLANDLDEIALPMLKSSPVLTDDDLIKVVKGGSSKKQIAIAGRPEVSDHVAGVLVDSASSDAVAVLAANEGADMTGETLEALLERHGAIQVVADSLAGRSDLTLEFAERLTAHVSSSLRGVLLKRYKLSEEQADRLTQSSRERATVDLVQQAASAEDVARLAKHLKENKRLTASLALRSLCTGEMRFFEAAMAELAAISASKASLMIHDHGELGLKALFERTGLDSFYFPAFRVAVDVYQENEYDGGDRDKERFRQRMIERVLTQYEDIAGDDLDYLLDVLSGSWDRNEAA